MFAEFGVTQLAYCFTCGEDAPVEAPECVDGHEDCPDRACLVCGTALVLDPILPTRAAAGAGPLRSAA